MPFNSAGQAVASTLAGHTPIAFSTPPPAVPLIKDGKLNPLAVTSPTRSSALPDVSTTTEAGYAEIEGEGFSFIVPSGTPKDIIALLYREIIRALALPDTKEKLATLGFTPVSKTPDESADMFKRESKKWTKVIRAAGLKVE